jgi:hypothetical protein
MINWNPSLNPSNHSEIKRLLNRIIEYINPIIKYKSDQEILQISIEILENWIPTEIRLFQINPQDFTIQVSRLLV